MRDYSRIEGYLNELAGDIYGQPPDSGHTGLAEHAFEWIDAIDAKNVLDVGCGETAFVEPYFRGLGMDYTGIALGVDAEKAKETGRNVLEMDMSFLTFEDDSFDLIWCRHTLEHSPMPIITLMEFHRVSKKWLYVIMPNPKEFTYVGRNHYYVADPRQIAWLLRRAGWKTEEYKEMPEELRYLCSKQPRISYEGYEQAPLSHEAAQREGKMFGDEN